MSNALRTIRQVVFCAFLLFAGNFSLGAPTIETQPSSAIVASGSTVTLSVAATGNGALSYRWDHFGAQVVGASASSLTLADVQPSDSGAYFVVVTDQDGNTFSTEADIYVQNATGVAIADFDFDSFPIASGALWPTFTQYYLYYTGFLTPGVPPDPLYGVEANTVLSSTNVAYLGGHGSSAIFTSAPTLFYAGVYPAVPSFATDANMFASANQTVTFDIDFALYRHSSTNGQSFEFDVYDSGVPMSSTYGLHSIVGVDASDRFYIADNWYQANNIYPGVDLTQGDHYHLTTLVNYANRTWSATLTDKTTSTVNVLASDRSINVDGYTLSGWTNLPSWVDVSMYATASASDDALADQLVFNDYLVTWVGVTPTSTPTSNPNPPAIFSETAVTTATGVHFEYAIAATNSPSKFAATGLPPGLLINPTTGVISGVATATGVYPVTLTARNSAGLSAPFTLTVTVLPDSAPTIAVAAPTDGSTLVGPLTIDITTTETSVAPLAQVEFFNGAIPLAKVFNPPYQIQWRNVSPGSFTITAVATDTLGLSTQSAPVHITVTAAPTPTPSPMPSVPVISGVGTATTATGAHFEYAIGATNSPSKYFAMGLPPGLLLNPTTGVISGAATATGVYPVTLTARNALGTSAPFTLTITVLPDSAPTIAVTAPTDGSTLVGPLTIDLTTTETSVAPLAQVEFFSGSTPLAKVYNPPYRIQWRNVMPGTYTISAVATDTLGLSAGSVPVHVTVTADQPPLIAITSPTSGSTLQQPASLAFSAVATSSDSTIVSVVFYDNGVELAKVTVTPFSFTWRNIQSGTHTLTAVAQDAVGISTTSAPVTISVTP